MSSDLSKFVYATALTKKKDSMSEHRALRIATVSMPTSVFAKLAPRTVGEQTILFRQHVGAAYRLITKQGPLFPDEVAICVLPEFYSHCSARGVSQLFMPYDVQRELLAAYCSESRCFRELLIMVNITALTETEVVDALGTAIGHKPRRQKTNMLIGIKNGEVVYINYKFNKGPADIPLSESLSSEDERNSYYNATVDNQLMKLDYLKQFKGITIAGSVCIDAAEGVVSKYLRKQFRDFSEDEFGPAVQIISSSSMALPVDFKKRSELINNNNGTHPIVTPKTSQGLLIQADGHDREQRSGVWLIDGENFVRQKVHTTVELPNDVRVAAYSVEIKLLHNKLYEEIGTDIDEEVSSIRYSG